MKQYPLLLLCVTCLSACSSAPKAPSAIFASRNEAARLITLGSNSARSGSFREAVRFYTEAYRVSTSVADDEGRISALDGLASAYIRSGSEATPPQSSESGPVSPTGTAWGEAPKTIRDCITLALSIAEDSKNSDLVAQALTINAEAALFADSDAETARAKDLTDRAVSLVKKPADRARALRAQAEVCKRQGDAKKAISVLDEAAAIDKRLKRFAEYASDRYLAASIYSKAGNYAAAREALLEALESDRRGENPAGIAADYRALGMVAEKTGDRESAKAYFIKARDVFGAARYTNEAADAENRYKQLK